MNYILSAEHIHKKYGRETVLRGASIHVRQGEIYGLVGKNGSGKSTLLRIIAGLIQGYRGVVSAGDICGRKVSIAAVINNPGLFLNLSALDNMSVQACLLGGHDQHRITGTLKKVGLEDSLNKPVKRFSLGMTQRLKIAVALMEDPDILILDEPLNGLDPNGIADLRELLLYLNRNRGMTILVSSHILRELEQIATCFGILHDGQIVKEVFAEEIIQQQNTLEELYMQHTGRGNKDVEYTKK